MVTMSTWDRDLRGASDAAVTIYMFWRTGPSSSPIPGVSIIGRAASAEALGWSIAKIDRTTRELITPERIAVDWAARVVWIPSAAVDGSPANPNQVKGWRRYWPLIPDCALKRRIRSDLRRMLEAREPEFLEAFEFSCPETVPLTVTETVPLTVTEIGGGSGSGSGLGPGKREGEGEPQAAPRAPLSTSGADRTEPDPTAYLKAFTAVRDEAIGNTGGPVNAITTADSTQDVKEFREAIGRRRPESVDEIETAARMFFARSGETPGDTYWRDRKWSLHVFSTQGLNLLDDARATIRRQAAAKATKAAGEALKHQLEMAKWYPNSANLLQRDQKGWRDLIEVLGVSKTAGVEEKHKAAEAYLDRLALNDRAAPRAS